MESKETVQLPSVQEVAAQFTAAQSSPKAAGNEAVQAAIDSAKKDALPDSPEAVVEQVAEEVTAAESSQPTETKEEKRDPVSAKFAAIARREKELRQREKEWQARQAQIDARQKEIAEKEEKLQQVKKAPLKTLKELGLTFQDITQDALGSYKEPEVDPVQQRFSEVEQKLKKIDEVERALNDRFAALEQKELQVAINEVNETIRRTVADEKYEYIQAFGDEGVNLVKEVIGEYFNEYQKLLDYSEACDIVEKYYEDQLIGKLLNTKKVKSRFPSASAPAVAQKPAPTKQVSQPAKEPSPGPRTLTQAVGTATQATLDIDKMSKHEAIQYLASKLVYKD